jgi:hypothetical protein
VSLEVKDLGNDQYEITCGDQRVRVAGVVGKVTAKAKAVQASAEPGGAIYPYYTIPVGPISKGKSRFSVMFPAVPGLRQEDLGELVLHLQEHPKWRQVQSKIAVMPKSAPLIVRGLGKKIP